MDKGGGQSGSCVLARRLFVQHAATRASAISILRGSRCLPIRGAGINDECRQSILGSRSFFKGARVTRWPFRRKSLGTCEKY